MSQRLLSTTKYIWYLLVLQADLSWSPVQGVSVRTQPKVPSTIESQAKFFQYRNFPTHEDFDQGHRLGSERHFTERHEKSRPSEGLFSAKVRWGDKKGGYGEHYWDLNHAGHAGDHNDHGDDGHYNDNSDDGSYHSDDDHNNYGYDGSKDHSSIYGNDDYDPEKSSYEENGRAKRAHPRVKAERKLHKEDQQDEEKSAPKSKNRKNKEQLQEAPTHKVEKYVNDDDESEDEQIYKKPKRSHQRPTHDEDHPKPKETKNQVVLVVKEKDGQNHDQSSYQNNQDYSQFVSYEGGAGVRQHHAPEVTAAASAPRLFLEPTTGHVVDRATGQAYVLQPIAAHNYN